MGNAMQERIINNRYRINKSIGSGGMGNVYLCEDTILSRHKIALKELKSQNISEKNIQTFKQEFDIMCRLSHPNVISVYDLGFDELSKTYFITMEYLKGTQIKDLSFTHKELYSHLTTLARTLDFIHSRGIIHRDITPHNIMMNDTTITLMDFGLSDHILDDTSKGTLAYMAPEVIEKKVSYSSDIFSLGQTFFYLFYNKSFYHNIDINEIPQLLKKPNKYYEQQKRFLSENPSPLEQTIHKMIAFHEKDRYSFGADIILDLQKNESLSVDIESKESKEAYILGVDFIGRQESFQLLKNHIEKPTNRLLWVQGDPGVGKSRLFREIKKYCRLENHAFFEGSSFENVTKQFGPFIPIINELLSFSSEDLVQKFGPQLKKITPDHQALVDISLSKIETPQIEYMQSLHSISTFLLTIPTILKYNIVIYLNDMQWADSSTVELLDTILSRQNNFSKHNEKLILMMSSRVDENIYINSMKHHSQFHTHLLRPLTRKNVEEYILSLFGKRFTGKTIIDKAGKIHVRAGGNPLYLQELIRHFVTHNIIDRKSTTWEFQNNNFESQIPISIHDLITARLNSLNLTKIERHILQVVAIVNRYVSQKEITRIVATNCKNILKKFIKNELLIESFKNDQYIYKLSHDLIGETLLTTVEPQLYINIAMVIESLHSNNISPYYEELVHFYHEGNDLPKTLFFLDKTISFLLKNFENSKALKYMDQLIEILISSGDTQELLAKTYIKKGEVLFYTGNVKEAEKTYRHAIEVNQKISKIEETAHARVLLAYCLAIQYDPHDEVITLLDRAYNDFLSINNLIGQSQVYNRRGMYYHHVHNDTTEASINFKKGLEIAERIRHNHSIALNLGNLGLIAFHEKDFSKALDYHKKMYIYLSKDNNKSLLQHNLLYQGIINRYAGNYEHAIQAHLEQLSIGEETGNNSAVVNSFNELTNTYIAMKNLPKAIEYSQKAEDFIKYTDDPDSVFEYTITHAKILFLTHKKDEAREILQSELTNQNHHGETNARLHYELWLMFQEDVHKKEALKLYTEILNRSNHFEHYERYESLQENSDPTNIYSQQIEASIKHSYTAEDEKSFSSYDTSEYLQKIFAELNEEKKSIHSEIHSAFTETVNTILTKKFNRLTEKIYHHTEKNKSKSNLSSTLLDSLPLSELLSAIADFNNASTLRELLTKILDTSINFLQAERGAILLRNNKGNLSVALGRNNLKESIEEIIISKTVLQKIVQSKKTIFIPDLIDENPFDMAQSITELNLRSIMCAPLCRKNETADMEFFGVIYLDSTESTELSGFKEHNIHLLDALGSQATGVITNMMLRDELNLSIEKRSKSEKAYEEAKIEAEQANEAKSYFLANISHEMRTPLNAIIGYLEILRTVTSVEECRAHTTIMLKESENLLQLIDKILSHDSINSQSFHIERRPFDISSILGPLASKYRKIATQKSLRFNISIGKDVNYHVTGDSHHIQQILEALLDNACKFTHEGAISLSIDKIKGTYHDQTISFTVADSGIGIAKEKQDIVFKDFVQADQGKTRLYGGAGIGLTIASQIANLLGSKIILESTEGKGSSFSFSLTMPITTNTELSPSNTHIKTDHSGNILLAEDYLVNQQVIKRHLESEGHRVTIANNGKEACELTLETRYDLILMDMQMPIMSGDEATRNIRHSKSLNQDTPILGLTANADILSKKTCLDSGMNSVLTKPIRKQALLDTVHRHLRIHQLTENENDRPPLDLDTALEEFGSNEVLIEIVEQFLSNVKDQIIEMHTFFNLKDFSTLEKEAHAIKGGAGSIEAHRLYEAAQHLEEVCKIQDDTDDINDAFQALVEEFSVLQSFTHNYENTIKKDS